MTYPPPRRHQVVSARRFPRLSLAAWTLVGVVMVGLLVGIVALVRANDSEPEVPVPPVARPSSAAAPSSPTVVPRADLPENAISGEDETFLVGLDIPQGKCSTAGALPDTIDPQWQRIRSTAKANWTQMAFGSTTGPVTVDLALGDVFRTHGYKPWHCAGGTP